MSIEAGTRLGPYEIVRSIGAGGMGEVYEATDTRLDRTVAVKVLPEHLSSDPGRIERLKREAKAISSLQHPHICTLFDIGVDHGTSYLVMEFLEGETLSDRLKKRPIPLDEALRLGSKIAGALDAAHRRGIVHRDLKPGNIMLTPSGLKLLDFGLAKPMGRTETPGQESAAPTAAKPLTEEGALVGTIPYMAPEQLEGKDADARTDIFAFGAMLYELVTGTRAFQGESQASLIAAIMTGTPKPLASHRPMSPPLLDEVVSRCLAKDPNARWQSARDIEQTLVWLAEHLEPPKAQEARPTSRKRWLWTLPIVAVALGALWLAPRSEPRPTTRMTIELPEGQELYDDVQGVPFALSPDGRQLVFAARSTTATQARLYLRRLDNFVAEPITEPAGLGQPCFSSDGRSIAYHDADANIIYTMALPNGAPTAVAHPSRTVSGITWTRDGRIVFGTSGSGLFWVPEGGGDPEPLTSLEIGDNEHNFPQMLPDGRGMLFTIGRGGGAGSSFAAVLATGATQYRELFAAGTARYLSSGHLVFVRGEQLFAIAFDVESLEVRGTPVSLDDQVAGRLFHVDPLGNLVFAVSEDTADSLVWVDRLGRETPLEGFDGRYHTLRLFPDGSRFVTDVAAESIWVNDLSRGSRVLIASEPGVILALPSLDGSTITYASGEGRIYTKSADGTGEAELVLSGENTQWPLSWSPDGRALAITEITTTNGRDVRVMLPDGERVPVATTAANENGAAFSPDGKWIAYVSDESGRQEVYVQPFPGPGQRVLVSSEGGRSPVWARSGDELFYREGTAVMAVAVKTTPAFTASKPEALFDGPYQTDSTGHPTYDVSPDGERFLMSRREGLGQRQLRVVLNLAAELESR